MNAAKKKYSFNDLRDLESKLVLIRGRGTKGGAEIDRFLDVSVTNNITIIYTLWYLYIPGLPLSL